MDITLAFTIHDKEDTIESVLRSWLDTLSGKHTVEILACFDACSDASYAIVEDWMAGYPWISYRDFVTDDIYEIRCNNLMLKHADGDLFLSCQDDNWQHTPHWDDALVTLMENTPTVGAVGLLAGVRMKRDFSLDRIECYTPEKDAGGGWVHGIGPDTYPLGVYQVDVINRPFASRTDLLRSYSGLDEAYCPMDWDDADLSLKLLRDGYTNLYLPLNVLNTCGKKATLSEAQMSANYVHGERIARQRWGKFVAERESSIRMLYPLRKGDDGRLSV